MRSELKNTNTDCNFFKIRINLTSENKAMKKILLTFFVISMSLTSNSQVILKSFQYKKVTISNKSTYHLVCDGDSVQMTKPVLKEKIYYRPVSTNSGNYTLLLNKKEKKGYLNDAAGQSLLSFPLRGKAVDITMTDGTKYTWKKDGGRGWKYSLNAKEIIACRFVKENGIKYIKYTIQDSNTAGFSNLLMICHIYGVDLIQQKAKQPVWISMAVATGVISSLASANSDPGPSVD